MSVFSSFTDLDSNLQDYILYDQEESYKSALGKLNTEKQEKPWSASLFRRVRQADNKEVSHEFK